MFVKFGNVVFALAAIRQIDMRLPTTTYVTIVVGDTKVVEVLIGEEDTAIRKWANAEDGRANGGLLEMQAREGIQ